MILFWFILGFVCGFLFRWIIEGIEFTFTDKNQYFADEYQEAWLKEEYGWWTPEGKIYIWIPDNSRLQQLGIASHEMLEYLLIHRTRLLRRVPNLAHWMSNCLEFVMSLGTGKIYGKEYWERQDWTGGPRREKDSNKV